MRQRRWPVSMADSISVARVIHSSALGFKAREGRCFDNPEQGVMGDRQFAEGVGRRERDFLRHLPAREHQPIETRRLPVGADEAPRAVSAGTCEYGCPRMDVLMGFRIGLFAPEAVSRYLAFGGTPHQSSPSAPEWLAQARTSGEVSPEWAGGGRRWSTVTRLSARWDHLPPGNIHSVFWRVSSIRANFGCRGEV